MRALMIVDPTASELGASKRLRLAGWQVEEAARGDDGFDLARRYDFDVTILDLNLPDMEGVDLIRRMRASRINGLILAVATSPSTKLKVDALTAGADDVVGLPLDQAELQARLHALTRRGRGYAQQTLAVGPVSFDLHTRGVIVHGQAIRLTIKESAILELLILRRNAPVSKETFLSHLYADVDREPEPQIIDVFVCKLRKKLADAGAPDVIETAWGRGYMVRSVMEPNKPGVQPVKAPASCSAAHEFT